MSRERRRGMVDRRHPTLSTLRQCTLLGISRSSVYYRPKGHPFLPTKPQRSAPGTGHRVVWRPIVIQIPHLFKVSTPLNRTMHPAGPRLAYATLRPILSDIPNERGAGRARHGVMELRLDVRSAFTFSVPPGQGWLPRSAPARQPTANP